MILTRNQIIAFVNKYWLELVSVIFAYLVILRILFDYTLNVPHVEYYIMFAPAALKEGGHLTWADFIVSLNPIFDGATDRVRFYSWFFWVIDTKFRLWLFQYVPFHPSVSLRWIVSLIILPFVVFKLSLKITGNIRASTLSGIVFLLSVGNLSTVTMFFHAAKPFATLGIAVCLLMTLELSEKVSESQPVHTKKFIQLWGTIVAFLFWDEIFYVYFLIAPILGWRLLSDKRSRAGLICVYLASFFVFCLFSLKIYPFLIGKYYNHTFDFFKYAVTDNAFLTIFRSNEFVLNLRSLISTHIDPFANPGYFWNPIEPHNSYLFWGFIFISIGAFFVSGENRIKYLSVVLSALVFVVFQHLIISRRADDGTTKLFYGAFYWGSSFSLLFSVWAATFFHLFKHKFMIPLVLVIVFILCYASISHNSAATQGQIKTFTDEVDLVNNSKKPFVKVKTSPEFGELSPAQVIALWRARHDLAKVKELLEKYPQNAYWLYYESYMQINGWKSGIKDLNKGL